MNIVDREWKKTRLILLGGFLGSGKTTALLRLARHCRERGLKVGVITNDQSEGLVDTERFRSQAFDVDEVTGGCFCCRLNDFIATADSLLEREAPDILLAEPVGSCADLVATVINPLKTVYANRFDIAPYAVLLDPLRVLKVDSLKGKSRLSAKVTYIFRMQQEEASCIVVNKTDLLSAPEREKVRDFVARNFPKAEILFCSALTGAGFDRFEAFLGSPGPEDRSPDNIDYDLYAEGEVQLGWLNSRMRLQLPEPRSLDTLLLGLAGGIRDRLCNAGLSVAHAKLLLKSGSAASMVSFLEAGRDPLLSQSCGKKSSKLELILNLRVEGDSKRLSETAAESIQDWSSKHQARISSRTEQCFHPSRPNPSLRIPGQMAGAARSL